jgi:hypothetical protein
LEVRVLGEDSISKSVDRTDSRRYDAVVNLQHGDWVRKK